MSRWLCLLLVPLTVQPSFATSIIAIWTAHHITIGADAKIVDIDGRDSGSSCKLKQARGVLFGIAGIAGDADGQSFYPLIADVLQRSSTLDERVITLEGVLSATLSGIYNRSDLK